MRKITVTIEHELTPMHRQILETSVKGTVEAFHRFWTTKSKKKFQIYYNFN